jgi:hypothetical protein
MLAYLCHQRFCFYLTKGEIKRQLRTKSKHKTTKGYANAYLWIVCIFLSTKGAYYGAKKQA